MQRPSQSEVLAFFADKADNAGFIERLKIRYRPLICPFLELLAYTTDHRALLDIGCGSGQFCLLAAEYSGLERIHGIEITESLVNNARAAAIRPGRRACDLSFSIFDGVQLPRDADSFDLMFMIDVLHHIPVGGQAAFVRHVAEVMRPGATLLIKDIDAGSPLVWCNRLHDLVFSGARGHEWSLRDAAACCSAAGLVVKEERRLRIGVYPHYFLLLSKPV